MIKKVIEIMKKHHDHDSTNSNPQEELGRALFYDGIVIASYDLRDTAREIVAAIKGIQKARMVILPTVEEISQFLQPYVTFGSTLDKVIEGKDVSDKIALELTYWLDTGTKIDRRWMFELQAEVKHE